MTRWGDLGVVLAGMDAASAARAQGQDQHGRAEGLQRQTKALSLIEWAHGRGFDITFIEVMPLGAMERDRADQFLPLTRIARPPGKLALDDPSSLRDRRPGPLLRRQGNRRALGFITPLTHNFCESCNRVRVTCTGTLYMCLGQEDAADLREPLRRSESDAPLIAAIRAAIARKPKGHDFVIARAAAPAVERHMNATGG